MPKDFLASFRTGGFPRHQLLRDASFNTFVSSFMTFSTTACHCFSGVKTESTAALGFAISSVYHSAYEEGAVIQFSPTIGRTISSENFRLFKRGRTKTRRRSGGFRTTKR